MAESTTPVRYECITLAGWTKVWPVFADGRHGSTTEYPSVYDARMALRSAGFGRFERGEDRVIIARPTPAAEAVRA